MTNLVANPGIRNLSELAESVTWTRRNDICGTEQHRRGGRVWDIPGSREDSEDSGSNIAESTRADETLCRNTVPIVTVRLYTAHVPGSIQSQPHPSSQHSATADTSTAWSEHVATFINLTHAQNGDADQSRQGQNVRITTSQRGFPNSCLAAGYGR